MAVDLGFTSNLTTNGILGLDDMRIDVVDVEGFAGRRGRHGSGLGMGDCFKMYIRCWIFRRCGRRGGVSQVTAGWAYRRWDAVNSALQDLISSRTAAWTGDSADSKQRSYEQQRQARPLRATFPFLNTPSYK